MGVPLSFPFPDSPIILIMMLRFSPSNYLTLTPDSQKKLQGFFDITNSSPSASAPFKIRCSRPDLFKVRPHVGVLGPEQQLQVSVTSQHVNSPQLAQQLTHDIRFKIEYVLMQNPPQDLNQALLANTDQNKQTHRLYISQRGAQEEIDSCGTVRDEKEDVALERFSPEELSSEERFEYLKQEIDRAEKERSEVIMAPGPKQQSNWVVLIIILLVMLLVGNATGKALGIGRRENKSNSNTKKKEYGYFGLEKLWAKEKTPPPEEPWWKFWN